MNIIQWLWKDKLHVLSTYITGTYDKDGMESGGTINLYLGK